MQGEWYSGDKDKHPSRQDDTIVTTRKLVELRHP
jgi:hypothetical protein